ncbi:mycofactocin system transcriptional regulator [Nocardioides sp. BGMRC 2183]|nr:mycofactocin system transcriptional regulator [Nocardioides sp. BGMRC 2183]
MNRDSRVGCGIVTDPRERSSARGRPVATTHAAIEQAAFELFAERGFAGTTLDAIANRVGVGKRTLFRYYGSKNDIPWGRFAETLTHFRRLLDEQSEAVPLHLAVHRAVVAFNDFPSGAQPSHLERMRLILTTPELQAHSALRYREWRQVIVEYVARRTGECADSPVPRVAGHVSLALALAAYEEWLADPAVPLTELVERSMSTLQRYLASG